MTLTNAVLAVLAAATPAAAPPPPVPADVVFGRRGGERVLAARGEARPVPIAQDAHSPSRSEDGRTLAYVTRSGRVVVVRDGRRRTVTRSTPEGRRPLTGISDIELAPAADRLLASDDRSWFAVDLATGAVRALTDEPAAFPRLSPDGRHAVWLGVDDARVRRLDRAAPPRRLPCESTWGTSWLGPEMLVLCGEHGKLRLVAIAPDTGATRTLPVQLPAEAADLGPTSGGRLLTVLDIDESRSISRVTVFDAAGRRVRALRPRGDGLFAPDFAFTPDGSALHAIRGFELVRVDLATGRERRVAGNVAFVG